MRNGPAAVAGSTSEVMVYHEFGTSRVPPRPVLGPVVIKNEKAIREIIGGAAVAGIIGGSPIHPSLGYDFETKA